MTTIWDQAKREFSQADPVEMAACSGAVFFPPDRLQVPFCGHDCQTLHPKGQVIWTVPDALDENEEVLILQYLTQATGLPLRNRWLSFLELPGGEHHHALFRKEAHSPLAEAYGQNPQDLLAATEPWGGRMTPDYGDVACIIPVFPRLPVMVILWGQDEEFSARSCLLFDASAPGYLSTASLYVLGIAVSQRIVRRGL